jgi:two-component system cell cycle response regulator
MANISLDRVLNCPNLPSLPSVAVDVLALTSKRNVNVNEIAIVVQNDQGLTAKILRTVNSSYYGLSKPCPTITRALTYLGLSSVKSLVLGFSLVDTTRSSSQLDLVDYWRRCIYGASAARRIAMALAGPGRAGACDPEEAFIAALMQDIGMPAIQAALGAEYQPILAKAGDAHEQLADAEMAAFGFSHAQAGAQLAEKWRLPQEIVLAIRHHHDPDPAPGPHQTFVRIVALGVHAAAALSVVDAAAPLARLRELAFKWLGFSDAKTNRLLSQISEDAREVSRLFRIQTGEAPNINQILEMAQEASLRHQFDVQREAETLRQTNSDLARVALTDGLTGAGNRNFFDTQLHRLFSQSQASGSGLAVIMVDADKFKLLNDAHGHQAGDAVLMEIAWRMKKVAASHEGALVCRYGGEEFALVVPHASMRSAAQMAENVRRAIADAPVNIRGGAAPSVGVTVSAGMAMIEGDSSRRLATPGLLVQAADKALYMAKDAGRNCVRTFGDRTNTAKAA